MCFFSDALLPSGFPRLLARTSQETTGVPTSLNNDPYRHSSVGTEFAVVAITNFLSEFERLDRE
jgi:hypothetical protein